MFIVRREAAARCLLLLQRTEEHGRYVIVRGFLQKWTLRRHGGGRLSEDPGLKCHISTVEVSRRPLDFANTCHGTREFLDFWRERGTYSTTVPRTESLEAALPNWEIASLLA